MPAVADMQNTIIKAFENDPRVVTAIISQVDTADDLANFWQNVYLRCQMLYDPSGVVGGQYYNQPYGGVPFSRGWIIAPDQTIDLPLFGYDPQRVIDRIAVLLEGLPPLGDVNGDGAVDISDLLQLLAAWGSCADPEDCPGDIDQDGSVGILDLLTLLANWS